MKALSLVLLLVSSNAFAESEIARVATDFDKDGKKDFVILTDRSSPENEDALLLSVAFGNGKEIHNAVALKKVGQDQESGATLKTLENGTVVISSVKDWSSSNTALDIYLSFRNGALKISGVDYAWAYRESFGDCKFDFFKGKMQVNGKSVKFRVVNLNFTETSSVDGFIKECVKRSRL